MIGSKRVKYIARDFIQPWKVKTNIDKVSDKHTNCWLWCLRWPTSAVLFHVPCTCSIRSTEYRHIQSTYIAGKPALGMLPIVQADCRPGPGVGMPSKYGTREFPLHRIGIPSACRFKLPEYMRCYSPCLYWASRCEDLGWNFVFWLLFLSFSFRCQQDPFTWRATRSNLIFDPASKA